MNQDISKVKKSLDNCYSELNKTLVGLNNKILVLDFTYCVTNNNELIDIASYFFYGVSYYNNFLDNFIRQKGNSIKITSHEKKVECVFKFLNNITPIEEMLYDKYSAFNTKEKLETTSINTWHDYCEEQKFGGFLMTTFYELSPYHSIGIYLVLDSPLENNDKNMLKVFDIRDVVKDYLMTEGWRILYQILPQEIFEFVMEKESLYKRLDSLERFQRDIDHFGHTIFNLFPPTLAGIGNLKNDIKDEFGVDSDYFQRILRNEKSLRLTNIIFQIIGQRPVAIFEEKTVCGLLQLLLDYSESKNNIDFDNIDTVDYIPVKNQNEEIYVNANKIFILLWNFWHNAQKYTEDNQFFVKCYNHEGNLAITFVNIGYDLNEQNRLYLLDQADMPISQRGNNGGLAIAKSKMSELGWLCIKAESKFIKKDLWQNTITLLTKK
jgi:hypothetical protein